VLLAETMLQQTQVTTVLPYYEAFLRRFPTVRSLAAAPLDDVLARWAGMGYARAHHLHRAAQRIVEEHGGRVPRGVEELMRLPGVGRYTAGAVASIAYDVRAPVVDGNVARVLSRLAGLDGDVRSASGKAELWKLAERLLPARGS
jgi:A/G-specific adenine glycosylase